ncbi:MAG: cyclohydrolase [Chloroflexi bacterium]|jgi:GTP cyclohydrolase I|nr:cyclohydrolase [Chloroflexota bacterium]
MVAINKDNEQLNRPDSLNKAALGSNGTGNKNAEAREGLILPNFHRLVTEEKNPVDPEIQAANTNLEGLLQEVLTSLGEDPARPGLKDTPKRVRRSLAFLTDGYTKNVQDVLGDAVFEEDYDEMVVVRDIEMYSMCEHHMLPFYGKCHIAYIPNGKIVGLSKLPRIVDVFSRRLQVQERLTTQIANALQDLLHPHGVGVVTEAYHLCMMMRGVQKQNSSTVASCLLGDFREDSKTRQEFLNLVSSDRRL